MNIPLQLFLRSPVIFPENVERTRQRKRRMILRFELDVFKNSHDSNFSQFNDYFLQMILIDVKWVPVI